MADSIEEVTLKVPSQRKLWLLEMWAEQRDTFKALISDAILFGLLLLILWTAHLVTESINYPPERKYLLEKIHFYGYLIILVIFILGFILKVIAYEVRGLRRNEQ